MLDLGKRFIVLLMLFVLAMPAAMIAGNVNYNVPMTTCGEGEHCKQWQGELQV